MKRTVWIIHDPGQPDSATARESNITEAWWEDALRGQQTVTRIEYVVQNGGDPTQPGLDFIEVKATLFRRARGGTRRETPLYCYQMEPPDHGPMSR